MDVLHKKRYNFTILEKTRILKKWRRNGRNVSQTARDEKVCFFVYTYNKRFFYKKGQKMGHEGRNSVRGIISALPFENE